QSASHALRCHRSQGRRGRSVSRTLRQPPPPVHRGSSTTAPPSKTLLTLSQTLFTLIQKGPTSRGSSLGGAARTGTAPCLAFPRPTPLEQGTSLIESQSSFHYSALNLIVFTCLGSIKNSPWS